MRTLVVALALSFVVCGIASPADAQSAPAAATSEPGAPAADAPLSLDSTVGEVARTPEGRVILDRLFPGLADGALVANVSVRTITNSLALTDEQRSALDAELRAIPR